MYNSISFILSSLIVSIIMSITYFSKKKVKTYETRIYTNLLIISVIGLIISIPLYYLIKDYQSFNIFTFLIPRLYLIYLMVFVYTMMCYFKFITKKVKTYTIICCGLKSSFIINQNFIFSFKLVFLV